MANNTGQKFGGRQKGTPNRFTKELRTLLKDVLYNELETLETRLDELEPKDRIELTIKLMPYVFPKLNNISHSTNEPREWGI
jgi:hypothetical protein